MIAVKLRFLAGRFHATPWGHHVNEGVMEWPPSPWRLLRSLTATFYRARPAGVTQDHLRRIVAALASPPSFHLPPALTSHTRHYDQANGGIKFFDTFAALDPQDEVWWLWPEVELGNEDRNALAALLRDLGTFGRAESWCEAELSGGDDMPPPNSVPFEEGQSLPGIEPVRVLLPEGKGEAVLDSLLIETTTMRKGRQLDPEGSRWVTYTRPADALRARQATPPRPAAPAVKPTVARFALDSTVLPLVQDALPFVEQVRRKLIHIRKQVSKEHSEVITGKTAEGVPLEGHTHAHYMSTSEYERKDGRLDHVTIYAPRGFEPEDVAALGNLRWLRRYNNGPEVHFVLTGLGTPDNFVKDVSLFHKARRWRSVTPFSLPRFASRGAGKPARPRDRPEEQLKRELRLRGLPEPVSVTSVDEYVPGERPPVRWLEFQARRFKGETGYGLAGFEIEFPKEERGPIALGFACHFGLGLFVPVE
ncbi:MAG: type I-U CRISPR-associated protein Cas5/Cas6 [Acidobacteria bacterium]|nr:type I-U CRISPR-associated protein Cas5/Cas6 [Acidobacteriota bacterium]